MLQPRRVRYRKHHQGRTKGKGTRKLYLQFGDFGIKALEPGRLTDAQLEAIRLAITRKLEKGARMWFRVFPDQSVTRKPQEARMGGGKGDVDHWNVIVRPGEIIVEVGGASEGRAMEALQAAVYKIPFRCKIVSRSFWEGSAYAVEA